MSLSEIHERNIIDVLDEEEILNEFTNKTKKKITCEDMFYKLYFKCNDIKFWFETTCKDSIINYCQKYKIELYFGIMIFIVCLLYFISWLLL